MNSLILFEKELRIKNKAKCPKCDDGMVKPKYPDQEEIWDYACDKCAFTVHYDKNVIVE